MNSITQKHQFPQARLSIFISGKPILQGKVYQRDGKWIYLANIDEAKLWRNYNGYSIANQILETFQKAKLRPLILYKHIQKNTVYKTTPSKFVKHGIYVCYGGHRQIVLPIIKWDIFKEDLNEPYNLPSMSVDTWLKPPKVYPKPISQDEYINQRLRLKEMFLRVTHSNG